MILVEMIARVCKRLFQARLRGAILHFRSVGATSIEDQMFSYTANMERGPLKSLAAIDEC